MLLSMKGLPVRLIQETVAAMAGLEVSVEAIQGLLEASAESLSPDYEAIHRMVLRAHLVQPDETSMRVDGENWYAWSFATELAADYELDPSQRQSVVERVLGSDCPGTVVSDGWCGHNVLPGKRGICWIHINRHPQGMEVTHEIEPRGPRSLAPPKYQRACHPRRRSSGSRTGCGPFCAGRSSGRRRHPPRRRRPERGRRPSTSRGSGRCAIRTPPTRA